jgi:hypothetical protein
LPESQPILSPIKAHDLAAVLQNFWGFGPFFSFVSKKNRRGSVPFSSLQRAENQSFSSGELRGNSLGLIQTVPFSSLRFSPWTLSMKGRVSKL